MHENEIKRFTTVKIRPFLAYVIQVLQGSLVAVMPVGDKQRLVDHGPLHDADDLRVRDGPQLASSAVLVLSRYRRGSALGILGQYAIDSLLGLRIECEDRAKVCMASEHQAQSVFLRPLKRALMRMDIASGRILQPDQGEKSQAFFFFSRTQAEPLPQKIDRALFFAQQHALLLPAFKELGRRFIGVPL